MAKHEHLDLPRSHSDRGTAEYPVESVQPRRRLAVFEDSSFEIADYSIKAASATWKAGARKRIRASDVVTVICGEHTDTAAGVGVELGIAQLESVRYFLLNGRKDKTVQEAKDCEVDGRARGMNVGESEGAGRW